tara:strand:+ start:10677 stop:11237 length:561 start_codon:yes stop_codon:yes gene_type:complete
MGIVNVSVPKISTGAGASKPKEPNVIFILASDVLTMPTKDGVVSTTDLTLKEGKKGYAVYLNPKSINRFDSSTGEASDEMASWISNFTATRPGDDEFFAAFLEGGLNEGFLILSYQCGNSNGARLQGTPCNPMYMAVEGQDSSEGIKSDLTFAQGQGTEYKMIHYRGTKPTVYDDAEAGSSVGGGL